MSIRKLSTAVGLTFVCAHLVIIALLFVVNFDEESRKLCLGILSPTVAGLTTSIVRYFVANRIAAGDDSPRASGAYVAISFIFPLALLLALGYVIVAQDINQESSGEFGAKVGIVETLVAVHASVIVSSLFKTELKV